MPGDLTFMLPVSVYRPNAKTATPVPADYLAYLLSLKKIGVTFSDKADITVGGHPGTAVTLTSNVNTDGVLGCPAARSPVETCGRVNLEFPMRIVVTKIGSKTLVAWLTSFYTMSDEQIDAERHTFETMLHNLHFNERGAPTSASPQSTASGQPANDACPDLSQNRGACLGPLEAGQYHTTIFSPALHYTVPNGWANYVDAEGNFLLVPPGGSLAAANSGAGDFVDVYDAVLPAADCQFDPPKVTPGTPQAFVGWLQHRPGLAVSSVRRVRVGGLAGLAVDLRMTARWKKTCPYSDGAATVPLTYNTSPTHPQHSISAGQVKRFYLLASKGTLLAIEIADAQAGHHIDTYAKVVETFTFAK
jgi:hypothetical protein